MLRWTVLSLRWFKQFRPNTPRSDEKPSKIPIGAHWQVMTAVTIQFIIHIFFPYPSARAKWGGSFQQGNNAWAPNLLGPRDTVDGRNPAPARAYWTTRLWLLPPHPLFNVVFSSLVRRCRISVIQLLCFYGKFFLPMLNGEHEGQDSKCVWWCRIFSINRISIHAVHSNTQS